MKHAHKYNRVKLGKTKSYEVYKCTLPGCSHYLPTKLVVGQKALCWRCNGEFFMSVKTLQKKPVCLNCKENKEKEEVIPDVEAMIRNILEAKKDESI